MSVRFSVLTPVLDPPLDIWERCAASVLAQTDADWQWCIADDGSRDPAVRESLRRLAERDERVTVVSLADHEGIAAASNAALDAATGEYLVLLDHDDELAPDALAAVAALLVEPADVVYTDEDVVGVDGVVVDPMLKPGWSPTRLRTQNYVNHLCVLNAAAVRAVGGFRSEFDGSQDHDLLLRMTERARAVYHLPRTLYRWRMAPQSVLSGGLSVKPQAWEAGRRAVQEHCDRTGVDAEVVALEVADVARWYRLRYRFARRPSVGVVVLVEPDDLPGLTHRTTALFRALEPWPSQVVLVVPAGTDPQSLAPAAAGGRGDVLLRQAAVGSGPGQRRMTGAVALDVEVLVFADASAVPLDGGLWLDDLVGPALEQDVGLVGARLLGPGEVIASSGYAVGPDGPGHLLAGLPALTTAYTGAALVPGERSAVPVVLAAMRRDVFEDVGGFSTAYADGLEDVDLGLKIGQSGRRVVCTPLVDAVVPDGWPGTCTQQDLDLLRRRWPDAVSDPYVNPGVRGSTWVTPCTPTPTDA